MALKQNENIRYAGELAEFANCADGVAVKEFSARTTEFFPHHFLDDDTADRQTSAIQGLEEQEPVWMPRWWGFQQGLLRAWEEGFPADWAVILIAVTHSKTSAQAWPYQRALMFLAVEPWRARFCGECGKPFVADKPATRFCSTKCAGNARQKSRNAWWRREGERWRRKRGKESTPTRGKP